MTLARILFKSLFFVLFLFFAESCVSLSGPEATQIRKASWVTQKASPGVVWKYYHFGDLFDARQSITVLDIDLDLVSVRVEHVDSGFFKTSERAIETRAIAAINGSFFNTRKGGSVVFLQKDGKVVTPSNDSPRAYRDNAGFAIDPSGLVSIIKRPEVGWKILNDFSVVLSSGPLLVADGEPVVQVQEKFNTNRHPRTAVGLTKKDHLIAIVVDGRSSDAYGMTTEELARVMHALGCIFAMNLDGGGSSTAWVKGQPFNGVVNFPSDNKKFDHEGERAVSNCIVFLPKQSM